MVYLGLAIICFLAVSGWHYARVWARFGNPLITNLDRASGLSIWQEPGFRTASSYLPVAESFRRPLFSGFASVPDCLYSTLWGDGLVGGKGDFQSRPPWNYGLMTAGYLLALLPSLAILVGLLACFADFIRRPRPIGFVLLGVTALYGLLLLYFSLKVPAYSAPKAFYGFGALAALCALGGSGWDWLLSRAKALRWALYAGAALWAVTACGSFWIRANETHTQVVIAQGFSNRNRHDLAVGRLADVLVGHPGDTEAGPLLSLELLALGQTEEAQKVAERQVRLSPLEPNGHVAMAFILAAQNQLEQAITEASRAAQLAPDHPMAWKALTDWLYRSGRKHEAIAACREALRVEPRESTLHSFLASMQAELGQPVEPVHLRLAEQLKNQ
jgi:tetratricopeptide (TPR) repeat protein